MAKRKNSTVEIPALGAATAAALAATGGLFYHLYVCPSHKCLDAANPEPKSWHQRGVTLPTDSPRKDVVCPGCGEFMVISRDGMSEGKPIPEGQISVDKDGDAVMHGEPIIYAVSPDNFVDMTEQIDRESAEKE